MELHADFEEVPPSAAAMVESMRAYGYSPGSAVADLIDNSIAAGARNVWLRFVWKGPDSYVSVTDDGQGMTEQQLRAAMRLGSRSPLEKRSPHDLGRFGLGLKTASLSQCRRLTVISRQQNGQQSIRSWDLDHIASSGRDRWELRTTALPGSVPRFRHLADMPNGTVVLWEVLDRLAGGTRINNELERTAFYQEAGLVRQHLAMVFQRYLDQSPPRLTIHTGGEAMVDRVLAWDPFLAWHPATHEEPAEEIGSAAGAFEVTGFVLPHKDRLSEQEHELGGGLEGWTSQQGFYVYRNERLLVAGGWLGLGTPRPWTMQAHHSLARIRIDLPNSVDSDWQIDVRKSSATVPRQARGRLTELAELVRDRARMVFAHRAKHGAKPKGEVPVRAWTTRQTQGQPVYRINRAHPTVKALLTSELTGSAAVEQLLRTLEETVPVRQIWLDTADREGDYARPFEEVEDQDIRDLMQQTYRLYRLIKKMTHQEAVQRVLLHEEFQDFSAIAATLGE